MLTLFFFKYKVNFNWHLCNGKEHSSSKTDKARKTAKLDLWQPHIQGLTSAHRHAPRDKTLGTSLHLWLIVYDDSLWPGPELVNEWLNNINCEQNLLNYISEEFCSKWQISARSWVWKIGVCWGEGGRRCVDIKWNGSNIRHTKKDQFFLLS